MAIGFEQLVDNVKTLNYEQQEMLKELITHWHIEARRIEMAADAKDSLVAFHAGKLKTQSAEAVINELHQSLVSEE